MVRLGLPYFSRIVYCGRRFGCDAEIYRLNINPNWIIVYRLFLDTFA